MKSELRFAQVFGPQQIKSGFDGAPTKSKFFHVELTCENYYEKASLFSVLEKKSTTLINLRDKLTLMFNL